MATRDMGKRRVGIEEELEAIEKLHARDERASQEGDVETLQALLSEDAVLMLPGKDWLRGHEVLKEHYRRMDEAMRLIEVTEYELDFEEVVVLGEYAFEWGTIRGAMRSRGADAAPSTPFSYKVLRILKKEFDGQWRVHRAIWNANPPG